jgi:hypothetical protein
LAILPIAAARPVASAAEQQQENDDKQEKVHGFPPFRMRRGGVALPIASAIWYASLQIQLLAELITNVPRAKKVSKLIDFLKSTDQGCECSRGESHGRGALCKFYTVDKPDRRLADIPLNTHKKQKARYKK